MKRAQLAKPTYMYASKTSQVVGFPASMDIYQGQILYKYVYDQCGNYLGTDPPKPIHSR